MVLGGLVLGNLFGVYRETGRGGGDLFGIYLGIFIVYSVVVTGNGTVGEIVEVFFDFFEDLVMVVVVFFSYVLFFFY